MTKKQDKLEKDYAFALKHLPFFVEFKDKRYFCMYCKHKGVTVKYFFLVGKDCPSTRNFCNEACMNMYLIKRL